MNPTELLPDIRRPSVKLTYNDILSFGETNRRIELFDGEPYMAAMPILKHQRIATRLGRFLDEYVEGKKIGTVYSSPIDCILSETTVLEPDVSFLSNERKYIDAETHYEGAPDVVIEILSESTERHDRTFKFQAYARGGAKEYWIVSPMNNEIEVYQNSESGFQLVKIYGLNELCNSPLFPDLNLEVAKVFQE